MSSIKERLKAQQYINKKIGNVEFKIKKMDFLEFQRLGNRIRQNKTDFEIELILSCIKDVKGLTTRDIADNEADFTESELQQELEFDLEYIQIYLGRNQEVLVQLYESIANDFVEFTEVATKKKKI